MIFNLILQDQIQNLFRSWYLIGGPDYESERALTNEY